MSRIRTAARLPLLFALVAWLAACSDSDDPADDAGTDVGADADAGTEDADTGDAADEDVADAADADSGGTDGGDAADGGDTTDAGDTADAGDTTDAGPAPAPVFTIRAPADGAVVAPGAIIALATSDERIERVVVTASDVELAQGDVADGAAVLELDLAGLVDGPTTLTATGLDGASETLATASVAIDVWASPPSQAVISATSGGALMTESGVVVTFAPGALAADEEISATDMELMFDPGAIPAGATPLVAIDLRSATDPRGEFELEIPATISYPLPETEKENLGAESGSYDNLAVGQGPDGPFAYQVSSVAVVGGRAVSGFQPAPRVDRVENLTAPGEPLRPYDLARIVGADMSDLPGDLVVRVGTQTVEPGVSADNTEAYFLVPPGTEGASVQVQAINTLFQYVGSTEVEIVARDEEPLSAAEADELIEALFGMIDTHLARYATERVEGDDVRLQNADARLAELNAFDHSYEAMRLEYAELRTDVLAFTEAERIAFAEPLRTLPRNLEILAGGGGVEMISQLDICLSLMIFRGMFSYWSFALNFAPGGWAKTAAGQALKLGNQSADAGIASSGCSDLARGRGIDGHECDLLVRWEPDPEMPDEPPPAGANRITGNVWGVGTRTAAQLGIPGLGDDLEMPVIIPIDEVYLIWESLSGGRVGTGFLSSDGGVFQISGVTPDTAGTLFATMPDGGETYEFPVTTAPEGETISVPVYVPLPPYEETGDLNLASGFIYTLGAAAGLSADQGQLVRAFDADSDNDVDAWFAAGFEVVDAVSGVFSFLARATSPETYESSGLTVPISALAGLPQWPVPADIDGDGALDLVGPTGVFDGIGAVLLTEGSSSGTAYRPLTFGAAGTACGRASGFAFGDFDGDGDPDIVVVSTPAPTSTAADRETVDGTICLASNDGTGAFEAGAGEPVSVFALDFPEVGLVGDYDADGALDAVLIGQSIVLWGDGDGTFTVGDLPEECVAPILSTGVYQSRGALLDVDQDGDLDVSTPRVETFNADNSLLIKPACTLRNDGGRVFSAVIEAEIDAVEEAECSFGCDTRRVADLDNDGWPDLVLIERGSSVSVVRGGAAGWEVVQQNVYGSAAILDMWFVDVDDDARVDVFVGAGAGTANRVGRNIIAGGNGVSVQGRDVNGAPFGAGARYLVDLNDTDFGAGARVVAYDAAPHAVTMGIGDATRVDVRVVVPRAGGDLVLQQNDVEAGETVTLTLP